MFDFNSFFPTVSLEKVGLKFEMADMMVQNVCSSNSNGFAANI